MAVATGETHNLIHKHSPTKTLRTHTRALPVTPKKTNPRKQTKKKNEMREKKKRKRHRAQV